MWLGWALLIGAALTMYAPSIGIPFLGDDYIFLERTRTSGFAQLWSFSNTDFGWYRPWSREFYFWTIQHLAGANASAFRVANLVLWIVSLGIFGEVVRRLSDARMALATAAGVASLGLWGAPLLWISGSQDLWMFFFLSLALLCVASRRDHWAIVPYAGALLSKETGAVFPLLAVAVWWLVQRRGAREVVMRLLPLTVLTIVWLFVHPVLAQRLARSGPAPPGGEQPLLAWEVMIKTGLSMVNADQLGGALLPTVGSVLSVAIGTVLLAAAMWIAGEGAGLGGAPGSARRRMALGGCWALVGWMPLFLPSISWHAYYGCIGATGAWVGLAAWLGRKRKFLVLVTLLVGTLRVFNNSSLAWDWGSEWYQRRAGTILGAIQTQLMVRYPTLPGHARVYFGHIPNNIGLVAGASPALRAWYRDSTLQAGFWSYYRPRSTTEPSGLDLFFHYDSTLGLQEVRLGTENVTRAARLEPNWESNHEALAMTLLRAGDFVRAADEFEKIAELPSPSDGTMFAALCAEASGDTARGRRLMTAAGARTGETPAEIADRARRLRATMPRATR